MRLHPRRLCLLQQLHPLPQRLHQPDQVRAPRLCSLQATLQALPVTSVTRGLRRQAAQAQLVLGVLLLHPVWGRDDIYGTAQLPMQDTACSLSRLRETIGEAMPEGHCLALLRGVPSCAVSWTASRP